MKMAATTPTAKPAPGALDMTCLAAATVAAEVRQRIELRLSAWHLRHLTDDAWLIATELVSNACRATPESEIRVWFRREPDFVELGVWDSDDQVPCPQPVVEMTLEDLDVPPEQFDANGGRGLQLIESLSCGYGVTETTPRGKWVWARLAI